ncbi:MAG: PilN domain-containing protein [Patescibacteria group bacterium]
MPGALGINLFPRKKPTLEQKRISGRIRTWGAIILFGYTLYTAGIFILGTFISFQRNEVKGKVAKTEERIKLAQKKESLELTLKGRIVEARGIIGGRTNYVQIINKIQALSPQGVSYQSLDFSDGKISLSGEAQNVLVFGEMLDALKKETDFSRVSLTSLSRTKTAGYSFSLEATLGK